MRSAPALAAPREPLQQGIAGVKYATSTYLERPRLVVSVSVAGARVSREAFERQTKRMGEERAVPVDDVGDATTFDPSAESIRVLKGSTTSPSR